MYCVYLALSECYCAGWRYQDVTCELSALDIIFFQSLFHLDRCFCHCSQQAKFRCTFHCRSLLCTKSEARLLKITKWKHLLKITKWKHCTLLSTSQCMTMFQINTINYWRRGMGYAKWYSLKGIVFPWAVNKAVHVLSLHLLASLLWIGNSYFVRVYF